MRFSLRNGGHSIHNGACFNSFLKCKLDKMNRSAVDSIFISRRANKLYYSELTTLKIFSKKWCAIDREVCHTSLV